MVPVQNKREKYTQLTPLMYNSRLEDHPGKKSQMSVTLWPNLSKFALLSML